MANKITIRKDVKLSIDGKYVNIEYDKCFAKKITSRAFPALINKDEWKSEGVEILGLLNLLEKSDDIDPFYLFRGDVAEHFVGSAVADFFGKKFGKENVEVIIFGDKQFTFGDMWHYDKETKKGNKDFGGRPDVGVKVKLKNGSVKGFVIEVKSKTHTKYNEVEIKNETTGETHTNNVIEKSDHQKIAVDRAYPEAEVQQGIFLANMSNLSQVTMFWVFFNDKQEAELREKLQDYLRTKKIPILSFDYKEVVYHSDTIEFNRDEIWRDMLVSSNNIKKMAKDKKIPLFMFKNNDIKEIEKHIAERERIESVRDDYGLDTDTPIPNVTEDDLPF